MLFKRIENKNGYDQLFMYTSDIQPENGVPIELGVLNLIDFEEVKRITNNKVVLYLDKNPGKIGNINELVLEILRTVITQQVNKAQVEHG